jgi:hypothetical protein
VTDLPYVCPRCLKLIPAAMLIDDPGITIKNELAWHLKCYEAFIEAHADITPQMGEKKGT